MIGRRGEGGEVSPNRRKWETEQVDGGESAF